MATGHVRYATAGTRVRANAQPMIVRLHLETQQVAGGGEGEAGAGGVVAEDGDAETGIEDAGALVALTQIAQGVRHGEHGVHR